jgi:hypothetical protein
MLEEVEALGLDLTIDYRAATKMWAISTVVENHGTEQGIGPKFEDALEVLKLRLDMIE